MICENRLVTYENTTWVVIWIFSFAVWFWFYLAKFFQWSLAYGIYQQWT